MIIKGRVTLGTASSPTGNYVITTYKDNASASTKVIDKYAPTTNLAVTTGYKITSLTNLYTELLPLMSDIRPQRSDKGPLVFSFMFPNDYETPSKYDKITVSTSDFEYTATTGRAICKFIDTSGFEYRSQTCSYAASEWTIMAPSITTLDPAVK